MEHRPNEHTQELKEKAQLAPTSPRRTAPNPKISDPKPASPTVVLDDIDNLKILQQRLPDARRHFFSAYDKRRVDNPFPWYVQSMEAAK